MLNVKLNQTPIEYVKGIGPYRGDLLKKELGIFTAGDLLKHYPFRYIDRTEFHKVNEINPQWPSVQVVGRLIRLSEVGVKRARRLVGVFSDETGSVELVWFKGIAYLQKLLKVNEVYVVYGKPQLYRGVINITHPEMETYQSSSSSTISTYIQPVYSTTEKLKKSGLDSKGIRQVMLSLIQHNINQVAENLPEYVIESNQLMGKREAVRAIHFPKSQEELNSAVSRLKYDELFFIQLGLLKNKQLTKEKFKGHYFSQVGESFNNFYFNRLPFPLTNAQKRVVKEIRNDTRSGFQMNRLIQGDVGSGKTVVALLSMLLAIDNGYQACMMAPTEILAQQHYKGIQELLGEGIAKVHLLTGSTPAKERRDLHAALEAGEIHILIGTHALIEDKVKFKNLGLVVIDEQHRFGVEQRAKLWLKNHTPPHMLVMTATPIPRTLAMTLYGDLDISIIDELPAGRKPIKTVHFYENRRQRVFGFMREQITQGRQVYVVYPLIKESEKLDLLFLEAGLEGLSREFPLPEYKISIVHGQMTPKEKEGEMQRFVQGKTQIMVATTVIEVGVNVPNASVMIIENAERFGLSQLHQLRGRVGRGAEQSYCILMSGDKLSKEGKERLQIMVETNDGFRIAEADLKLRGPGDISGTQQSGVLDLKMANLVTDQELLSHIRNQVIAIFDKDPQLMLPENGRLNAYFQGKKKGMFWEKIS
ncbi:MAG TPA: ATP-dependent DNA helicase RecG [Candidatus Sphingobacterium stercoripullorum]|uniref:ATP-dependent DNA helicase RecG n=1 Tax=Candidatus Sphingobacterium stercoripullorum TaxID=2838759 RepID=A0A9D1WAS4_9SPHI|nr:ATP-dependent DNA helicase RecG [Candidatus Sphingobacterium stercoripullorum]